MDKLPHHCQENSVTLKQNDYMNFEMMTMNGHKMSFNFIKIPNFYVFDDKEYYAVCMFQMVQQMYLLICYPLTGRNEDRRIKSRNSYTSD